MSVSCPASWSLTQASSPRSPHFRAHWFYDWTFLAGVGREANRGKWAPFLVRIDLEEGVTAVWKHLLGFSSLRPGNLGEAVADKSPGPEVSPASWFTIWLTKPLPPFQTQAMIMPPSGLPFEKANLRLPLAACKWRGIRLISGS